MVTRPKGKLAALLAIFAAIGIVTATGAFTSVSAERTVSVNVSDDADALLALEPNSTSSNGQVYAETTTDNQVTIDLSAEDGDNIGTANGGAGGINENATTEILYLLNVTNQGTQAVDFGVDSVTGNGSNMDVYVLAKGGNKNLSAGDTVSIGTGNSASIGLKLVVGDVQNANNPFDVTITLTAQSQ